MENLSNSRTQELKANVIAGLAPVRKKFSKFYQDLSLLDSNKSENKKQVKISKELSLLLKENILTDEIPSLFLSLPAFKHYQSCHIFLQEKGKTTALHFFSREKNKSAELELQAQHFNKMFSLIKKSKNKFFHQNLIPEIDLKLVGSFMANAFVLKTHNLIFIVSRNEFLPPSNNEINIFDNYSQELPIFLEKILKQAVVKARKKNYIECLQLYPSSLSLLNANGDCVFQNFSSQTPPMIKATIELPNAHQLIVYHGKNEDTSSELFHHQRISLLGELLNTLRHELNNPLFGMKLTSDLLVLETEDEEQSSILKEIAINVTRSQNIMENFTNLYTKTDVYEHCTLKRIIDESLTLSKSEIRQVRISQFYEGEINPEFKIYTNPTSLVQVFFNLIVNGSQAMRHANTPSPKIIFNFKKTKEKMFIEVMDNGPGIPASIEAKLFEPFFTTKTHGTGLGLSIAMSLVKHLKGEISYQKRTEGGAHFTLSFPIESFCPDQVQS